MQQQRGRGGGRRPAATRSSWLAEVLPTAAVAALCALIVLRTAVNSEFAPKQQEKAAADKEVPQTSGYSGLYTSCQLMVKGSNQTKTPPGPWRRGSGQPLRSWLESIVPLFTDSHTDRSATPAQLFASFGGDAKGMMVQQIGHLGRNLLMRRFGEIDKPDNKLDGWVYGPLMSTHTLQGSGVAYIYDDLSTVILGKWRKGRLAEGRRARIVGYRCEDGMMNLKFSKPNLKGPAYTYEPSTLNRITNSPHLVDPLERRNIYIKESNLKDMTHTDGVFAKRMIPAHTVVAVYAGVFSPVKAAVTWPNMTRAEQEDVYKNRMTFNKTHVLDVPPSMSSLHAYKASLGHKVNNDLMEPNAEFSRMHHPRFGPTMCIRSLKAIQKDEEVFVDYKYHLKDEAAPDWYRGQFEVAYWKPSTRKRKGEFRPALMGHPKGGIQGDK